MMDEAEARYMLDVTVESNVEHTILCLKAEKKGLQAETTEHAAGISYSNLILREDQAKHDRCGNEIDKFRKATRLAGGNEDGFDAEHDTKPIQDVENLDCATGATRQPGVEYAPTPGLGGASEDLTRPDGQRQPVASSRKGRFMSLYCNSHQEGDDSLASHPIGSPGKVSRSPTRIGDKEFEKLTCNPIVISNTFPMQGGMFEQLQIQVIDEKKREQRTLLALRDTGSDFNGVSESCARGPGFEYFDTANLPEVGGFGPNRVKPIARCWSLIKFPHLDRGFRVEFYVFSDKVDGKNMCLLSNKTCAVALLFLDGLKIIEY